MRVIWIDPAKREVLELGTTSPPRTFRRLDPHAVLCGHHVIPDISDIDDCYCDRLGVVSNREKWFFGNVLIWGPMMIYGRVEDEMTDTSFTLELVRDLARWYPLDTVA